MQNVVTLKLYTDFDELQWAMKRCFRLEEMEQIDGDDEDGNAQKRILPWQSPRDVMDESPRDRV